MFRNLARNRANKGAGAAFLSPPSPRRGKCAGSNSRAIHREEGEEEVLKAAATHNLALFLFDNIS